MMTDREMNPGPLQIQRNVNFPKWSVTAAGDAGALLIASDGRSCSNVKIWTDNDRETFAIDADVHLPNGFTIQETLTPIRFRKFARALAWANANLETPV
jgi:hypothetical protein